MKALEELKELCANLWKIIIEIFYGDMEEPITQPVEPIVPKTPIGETLALIAENFIGTDASPKDTADDELACVDSLTLIVKYVFPDFRHILSTQGLKKELDDSHHFKPTLELKRGNIILSVTDTGNGTVRGHCGILRSPTRIMSNTSADGLWKDNYSLDAWIQRFRVKGGLKIYVYEPIEYGGENSP